MVQKPFETVARALALVLAWSAAIDAGAQESPFLGWDAIGDSGFEHDPDRVEVTTFAIRTSSEVQFRFYKAEQAMKDGEWMAAVEPLQEILTMFPNHLYPVAERRWVGAGEYARFRFLRFAPEGRRQYQEWAAFRTEPQYAQAVRSSDPALLFDLASRWPLTREGMESLRRLGDRFLEAGYPDLAARCYLRRLAFEDPPGDEAPDVAFRAAAALAFQADTAAGRAIAGAFSGARVRLRGEEVELGRGFEELLHEAPAAPADWPEFGGGPAHEGVLRAQPEALSLKQSWARPGSVFSLPDLNPFGGGGAYREIPFHAVSDGSGFFVSDGLSIRSFSFLSPDPKWVFEGPLVDPAAGVETFGGYLESHRRSHPLGALARELPLVPTVSGDLVVAALFDARPKGEYSYYDRTQITTPIPKRSLYAVDRRTGALRWTQSRPEEGELAFVNRLSVINAPVAVGDRLIASGYILEGAINVYVACFSARDGSLLWKTPIMVGQQELTMFNKAFKEFTLQTPAERDGAIYLCTNLGLLVSLDTLSGDVRWATQYDAIEIQGSLHYRHPNERSTTWANDPPVAADGVVVFAPLDSEYCYGVDAATGKVLWQRESDSRRREYRSLLGVDDGVVVFSGYYGLGFHDLKTGALLKAYEFDDRGRDVGEGASGRPSGRGILGRGVVYQPMEPRGRSDGAAGLLELRWSRTEAGDVRIDGDRLIPWELQDGANVLVQGDFVVAVGPRSATVFADVDSLVRRVRARVEGPDATPEDMVELADLENQRGRFDVAVELYRRAMDEPGSSAIVQRSCRDGLYRAYRALAQEAAARDDADEEVRYLRLVAEFAPGDHEFLETAERLLERLREDSEGYLSVLDAIDRRCPDAEYVFRSHAFGGFVRAGLFSLDQRAATLLATGRVAEAVNAWQRIILEYRDDEYQNMRAGEYARQRIAEVMERHGADVFETFEHEVQEQHQAALSSGDAMALRRLIESYPNSPGTSRRRLDLARLLLSNGDAGEVFEIAAPVLSDDAVPEGLKAESLRLVAEAAERTDDLELARVLWRRLGEDHADVLVPGGSGRYGDLAREALVELPEEVSARSESHSLSARPALRPRVLELEPADFHHLVPVEGGVIPGQESILIHESPGAVGDTDSRLRCIAIPEMIERWRAPISRYYDPEIEIRGFRFGHRLLVHQRYSLRGYDAGTGRPLYVTELPVAPVAVRRGSGLLHCVWDDGHREWAVAAFAPATGSVFWKRNLRLRNVAGFAVGGGNVLVLGPDGLVEALDELTGASRYRISQLELSGQPRMRVFEEHSLLVVAGNAADGARRSRLLLGYDLLDGRPLWQIRDLKGSVDPNRLDVVAGRIIVPETGAVGGDVVSIESVEPRTGARETLIDGLAARRLRRLDEGVVAAAGHAILAGGGSRREPDRLAVLDLAARRLVHELDLEGVDAGPGARTYRTRYRLFPVDDGSFAGTIDVDGVDRRTTFISFVFRLDPVRGSFESARVPSTFDGYSSSVAITRNHLIVMRDDGLYAYPAGSE